MIDTNKLVVYKRTLFFVGLFLRELTFLPKWQSQFENREFWLSTPQLLCDVL